ncbi:DUF2326 domain-containing protein [Mesorhizobium sp. M0217]|uniref:DUF2326 domain-containing protein n=1 Tax=unclassified Mesorhizobium TaxID=325217 RepID=UPI00333DD113
MPTIFEPIDFNFGADAVRLNVVLGEVRKPADKKRDSHNLGKTTLLHLIDFMLLRGMSPEFFLVKHKHRFEQFMFFLEISLNSGDFATIRRSPGSPNEIGLKRHAEGRQNFYDAADDEWDHATMPIEAAKTLLDGWLDLRVLKPYDYRKAITYFLRSQDDWSDELQLRKFSQGKDSQWKPFVAHLFGFKGHLIDRKYQLDEDIQTARQRLEEQQAEVQFKEDDLPALITDIARLRQEIEELSAQLDAFHFDAEERRIMTQLVDEIESEIAQLNSALYDIRYDIRQIDVALEQKDKFDLGEIEEVFRETKLYFVQSLKRKYEELVAFNKKVTHERDVALRARRRELESKREVLQERNRELDGKRQASLSVLKNTDTFSKYKHLQKQLIDQRAHLVYREGQQKKLEAVAEMARSARELERDRGRIVDEMKVMVAKQTPVAEKFRAIFNRYCQQVLDHNGVFYFRLNSSNNLDYEIGLEEKGQIGKTSSQGDGTSYKKLICALFDLALLKVYEEAAFFHFVFHDGVLEALDNRKKEALLKIVREQIASGKTQYILTLIEADMPRDAKGKRIAFGEDEVILRLHDEGDDGRLFRMTEF